MAKPIIDLPRGVPSTDKGWLDVFARINKFLKVSGEELQIEGGIQLPPSEALSVLGRAQNTPGAPADIIAGSDETFLRRTGGVLGFTTIIDTDIPGTIARDSDVDQAITDHEAEPDPHPQYTTTAELTSGVESGIGTHEGSPDPHPGYALENAGVFTAPVVMPTYTVATLPSAAAYARGVIYVSDEAGGAVLAFSDGTNWRRVTDRNIVS